MIRVIFFFKLINYEIIFSINKKTIQKNDKNKYYPILKTFWVYYHTINSLKEKQKTFFSHKVLEKSRLNQQKRTKGKNYNFLMSKIFVT